jgi:hypothetical protein
LIRMARTRPYSSGLGGYGGGVRRCLYTDLVNAAHDDLHGLVDRLTPDQVDTVRAIVREFVADAPGRPDNAKDGVTANAAGRRRLSFAGLLRSGKSDLAARSEEILSGELGRRSG